MEVDHENGTKTQTPKSAEIEEFLSEDDEILTTTLQDTTSSLAKNKLKELSDILQDYSEFDEIELENEVKGHRVNGEDATTFIGDKSAADVSPLDGAMDNMTETSKTVQNDLSTVNTTHSHDTDTHSCQNSHDTVADASMDTDTDGTDPGTSIITFPNNESCDLSNSDDHKKIVGLFREYFQTFENTKETLSERDQSISKMTTHISEVRDKNQNLNIKLQELLKDLAKSQETLKAHDTSARTAIQRIQQESDAHIKTLKAKCASMQKDKEAAVMNYARREKELLDAKHVAEAADKRSKEAARDKEKAITQMKGMKMDMVKLKAALERQEVDNGKIGKEIDKWKEEANSHVIKVKWAQNKLKSETDLHNETKEKLAKAVHEIKRAREEAETIRVNCQGMIKTYQESEEMKSSSLDSQLKEKEMLLSQQEAKSGELEGIHKHQMEELRRLKQQYKDVFEENTVIKTRVDCLEKERLKNEETLKGYTEILNRQKKEAMSKDEKLRELEEAKTVIQKKEEEIKKIQETLTQERESAEEMKFSEQAWKIKQQELLEFTQKVSTKNAELASGNEILVQKLEKTSKDLEESKDSLTTLENELKTVKSQMESETRTSKVTTGELHQRLEDKVTSVNHLTTQVEELKDEIRTLKRKHNSSVKDLTRQLHQARKRLEPYESASFPAGSGPTTEDGSMGSRTSSNTSIDCVGKGSNGNNATQFSHNSAAESGSLSSHSNGTDVPETVVASTGEISTQTLIERIVRLQRIHARKNEKIDFLQDHVQQLIDEMQKKNRIIQHYLLREEGGLLMPETALTHAAAGERGSGKMSRHLTEEVNRRMQSVLEDTLIKNITLKENVEALGSEIARLSASKR